MISRLANTFLLLCLSGCVTASSVVQTRHAAEFGCDKRDVKVLRMPGATFRAQGCGESAIYVCGQNTCVRNSEARSTRSSPSTGSSSSRVAAAKAKRLRVERGFNEARKVHMVRGEFEVAPGLMLSLTGAPALAHDQLVILLKGRSLDRAVQECRDLSIKVNAEPLSPNESKSKSEGREVVLESRFNVSTLSALAQDYATFEVSACSYGWKFSEADIEEMRKFLVIYGQISEQVASGTPVPVNQEL